MGAGSGLHVVATLPPEEALVASGRLDAGGIPASLRRAGSPHADDFSDRPELVPFHVMVAPEHAENAKSLLDRPRGRDVMHYRVVRAHGRDPARIKTLFAMLLITAIALGLSALMLAARWFFSGTPFPR
ncbi:MAG: hypothetical protein NVSMB57_10150 [Actinomycetota bacterium]